MIISYIEEIKTLSNTLYNCTAAMQLHKDIDSLKSDIKQAGFNKNSIKKMRLKINILYLDIM